MMKVCKLKPAEPDARVSEPAAARYTYARVAGSMPAHDATTKAPKLRDVNPACSATGSGRDSCMHIQACDRGMTTC